MFEQTFKNIDDVLWKESGCSSELDYTEQTSWMLFLKYLDDLEQERAMEAELRGKVYDFLLDEPHRWASWAAPKKADGSFDHDTALVGDDLIDFVNGDLFPYLRGFKERASSSDTIEYKIGAIFDEIKNKFQSGYSLRDALELMDALRFRSQKEKHELSHLYEAKIKNMGNAGRNGGEYYTPRPLIRALVQVTAPKIGETIYDGACGSAGFLCEAHDYLRHGKKKLTTAQLKKLQEKTFYGKEKKSLAYIIGIMNMILHGIDAPNIIHTNTLSENLADIQERDRFDIILANPPFGGKERKEVQQNFPIKTGETAFLFLQHFIKRLKAGGRAAVVIKNTFLSNSDNASKALRQELNAAEIIPRFLLHFMKSSSTRNRLTRGGGGANINNINQAKLSALSVPVPPFKKQEAIATALDELSGETLRLESLFLQKFSALTELKQSILQKAFSGELTADAKVADRTLSEAGV